METKNIFQNLPYMDRLDYVSTMAQEHAYSLTVEKLFNNEFKQENLPVMQLPLRAQCIRVLYLEITRILNHLLALTTHAMDLGALSPFLWHFEEREKLIQFYERISGARMHAAFIRPGGIAQDLPLGLLTDIYNYFKDFNTRISDVYNFLNNNRVFRARVENIGIVNHKLIYDLGFSGVMARGSGLPVDVRLDEPYENITI